MASKFLVGIDEVGRGPLAGPVAVCTLCICGKINKKEFENFKDSKKLSHKQRVIWLEKINLEKKKGNIIYAVCMESNKVIDKRGLSFAIKNALANSLKKINFKPARVKVLLDGGLKAPVEYITQKTIVKGDEKELCIALASITAKVTRDELLVRLATKYPGYSLEKHKGYGTAEHYKALKNKGISEIHRKSFLKCSFVLDKKGERCYTDK